MQESYKIISTALKLWAWAQHSKQALLLHSFPWLLKKQCPPFIFLGIDSQPLLQSIDSNPQLQAWVVMSLVQKSISFCPASVIGSERDGHITQQSSVIISPRILVGYKKLIYIFLTHGSAGHPVSRASFHQTSGQSQLHMSPSWALRMLGAWPSHAHTKRATA